MAGRSWSEKRKGVELAQQAFEAKTLDRMMGATGGMANNPEFARGFGDALQSSNKFGMLADFGRGLSGYGGVGSQRNDILFNERVPESQKHRDTMGLEDRKMASDMAKAKMGYDANIYGYDKNYEATKLKDAGDLARHTMQHGAGGSLDRGYQSDERWRGAENDTRKHGYEIEHGQGGSRDRGYQSEKDVWTLRTGAEQAAAVEEARRRAMEQEYKMATGLMTRDMDPMTAEQAHAAVNSFRGGAGGGSGRPEQDAGDSRLVQPQQRLDPEQQQWNSRQAEAAYQKSFGGGQAEASLQTMAAPPQVMPMAMAQPIQPANQSFAQAIRSQGAQSAFGNTVNTPIIPTLWEKFLQNRRSRSGENIYKEYATPRADGGPIEPDKPYLVGERGPEVVVPQSSGTVIPNEQSFKNTQSFAADGTQISNSAYKDIQDERAQRGGMSAGNQDGGLTPGAYSSLAPGTQFTDGDREHLLKKEYGIDVSADGRSAPNSLSNMFSRPGEQAGSGLSAMGQGRTTTVNEMMPVKEISEGYTGSGMSSARPTGLQSLGNSPSSSLNQNAPVNWSSAGGGRIGFPSGGPSRSPLGYPVQKELTADDFKNPNGVSVPANSRWNSSAYGTPWDFNKARRRSSAYM